MSHWLFHFQNMNYILKTIDGTACHFHTFADALWALNEGPQAREYKLRPTTDFELWRSDQEWYMLVNRRGSLFPTLSGAGHGPDLMRRLIEEVAPYMLRPDGSVLKPYEMSRAQWGAVNIVGSIAYGVYPCIPEVAATPLLALFESAAGNNTAQNRPAESLTDILHAEYFKRFGHGHNGPEYRPGSGSNSRHEVHVGYALARGDDVPQEVLDEYRGDQGQHLGRDMHWALQLMDHPGLRGKFKNPDVLSNVLNILHHDKIHLDAGKVEQVLKACEGLPEDASYTAVDNCLYQAGIVELDQPCAEPTSKGDAPAAINDAAARLAVAIAEWRNSESLLRLKSELAQSRISQREYRRRVTVHKTTPSEVVRWANTVIGMVVNKDIKQALDILDCQGNDTSRKFLEAEYGVKLSGFRAAERRKAVFRLLGYEKDADINAIEAELKAKRETLLESRKRTDIIEAVEALPVTFEGKTQNWRQVIDSLIERGFRRIHAEKKGAVTTYQLGHETNNLQVRLKAKNMTLQYAKLVLDGMSGSGVGHAQAV